jgi:transposase
MLSALALVAGGMSQRKAAKAAGVSLAGLVKALQRQRRQA